MKHLYEVLVLAIALIMNASGLAAAQEISRGQQYPNQLSTEPGTEAKILVLTGCLERGSTVGEYSLRMGANLWELSSSSVNLRGHLDQMVVVTVVSRDGSGEGVLNVISLSMDSSSCNL